MTDLEIEEEAMRTARRLVSGLLPGHREGMRSFMDDEFQTRDGRIVNVRVTILNTKRAAPAKEA